ncbi:MAG: hypothetical protein JNJ73_05225 [Hyphomonadaceae bacterium]|nr:hypothetical protein [Hyphomonadaceae bacterium]
MAAELGRLTGIDPIYVALAALSALAAFAGLLQWLDERRWKREREAEEAAAKHSAE